MSKINNIIPLIEVDENKHRHLKAESTLVISCGEASIILYENGEIDLIGTKINLLGENLTFKGRKVSFN